MKQTVIQQRLNDAMRRRADAQSDEWRLSSEIQYHDRQASEIRKTRQKSRSKKDRAEKAVLRYSALLIGYQP